MVEIICSRSGLKFEAPNRRSRVHPKIAWYANHKNPEIRYPALRIIERGKAEEWTIWEQFEAEIQKELNPSRPEYDFEGAWVARVLGTDPKYRFERKFLEAVDTEASRKRFNLKEAEDGVYECCYRSGKGNETRSYYRTESGKLTQIELSEVEQLFSVVEPPQPVSVEGCILVERYLGKEGEVVEHEGEVYVIVRVDSSVRAVIEYAHLDDEEYTHKDRI